MQLKHVVLYGIPALLAGITFSDNVKTCQAINNPSARYCSQLGYIFEIEKDSRGNENGVCILPDNSRVNAWDFLRGKEGQPFSYCARHGYTIETHTSLEQGYSTDYSMCVKQASQTERAITIPMLTLMESNNDTIIVHPVQRNRLADGAASLFVEPKSKVQTLPLSFDWRNKDGHSYIGPVRNQGHCGDCYAFGAAAAAEGAYNVAEKKYDANCSDFSESFIAWCLGTYGPYSEHFSGCEGADYEYAELEALTREGITWERYFPYTETDPGSCTHDNDPIVQFSQWGRITPNDINAIKAAMLTNGVLDVAVQVNDFFLMYIGGIYSDSLTTCPEGAYTKTNHAVALVGWGYDDTHGDYWILRNSWGATWGEDGYMRIKTTSARVACSTTYLAYPGLSLPRPPLPFSPIKLLLLDKLKP